MCHRNTFFVPLHNFCSISNIFHSCFHAKNKNNNIKNNKASLRTFERCLRSKSPIVLEEDLPHESFLRTPTILHPVKKNRQNATAHAMQLYNSPHFKRAPCSLNVTVVLQKCGPNFIRLWAFLQSFWGFSSP